MQYRLGIDLGTNSLGWAVVELREQSGGTLEAGPLIDLGVRIFSDARNAKDKASNAAKRRAPRAMRRNRDRRLARSRAMMLALQEAELMPLDERERRELERLDPWVLRANALDQKLSLHEIGRALFHLQQRRGFLSNRKTDGDDAGAMYAAIEAVRVKMAEAGARTLGELFGHPRREQSEANKRARSGEGRPLPQARVKARTEGSKIVYDYYPERAMILNEFDQIWRAQSKYHALLMTPNAEARIRSVIENQRPLKPQPIGKCTFLSDQPRAPKALPSSQYARILQEVNNLRVGAVGEDARALTPEQRSTIIESLIHPSSKSAARTFKTIRKKLNLPESQKFSLESAKRDGLVGDLTAARLMQDDAWGAGWLELDRSEQDEIVMRLIDDDDEASLVGWLTEKYGLDRLRSQAVSRARLPDMYGKLSAAALARIVPRLEQGERYDEAATAEFKDHRGRGDGVVYEDGLPYYGEVLSRHTAFEKASPDPSKPEEVFGRVANPTVHVALNELRKVINDMIERRGPPAEVVLELARDLPLSDKGLRELEKVQTDNQNANEIRRRELGELKQPDTHENRLKLRLYEEALKALGGQVVCVFSGDVISKTDLLSSNIEIEHILPLSKTLDDSFSNKVLATRASNRIKRNNTPFEAFGHNPGAFDWEAIGQRASALPAAKAWRFAPDAMQRWEERGGGFLARQLNDTRYIARLGKTFVEALFGGQGNAGSSRKVWVVPGQLTSDLRHFAGFNALTGLKGGNRKDRTDHRHHAVDALVVALTDQSMLQRAATLQKREDVVAHHEIMQAMAEPLKRYRKPAEDRLSKLIVSHKPDHGFQDAMHNDTAFGVTQRNDEKGQKYLVTRKPLEALDASNLTSIVDESIRAHFIEATEGLTGKEFAVALLRAGEAIHPPVRRVRIETPMKPSSFIVIHHGPKDEHHKAYKGDGNYCYDIFADNKGKWTGQVVSTFEAYQRAREDRDWWRKPVTTDGTPVIMRLRKGDMLEITIAPGQRRCVVMYQFSDGKINMAEHHEANASARVRAKELPRIQMAPSSLQSAKAVLLSVSPAGRVRRV